MEIIKLNLIPSGATPVVHVKQYDIGRTWRFELYEGAAVYTLDGTEVIECDIHKRDGNIVTVAVTNTSDSYIDIETTLQMTACSGDQLGAIKITKGDDEIASINFIFSCQKSPLENGIESESSIHNLETQIAEAVADQYDADSVVFDSVPTQGHGTGFAVTSEGVANALDNLPIPDELNDLSDVNISGQALGEALVWDGTKWVNGTPTLDVGDLDDVTITTPTDGEILVYNNGSWENQANPASTANFAPDYDDTATYNTNDKVIYQGLLYACLEDSVTGAWDSTKWQNISVADYTAELLPIESGSATNTKDYIDGRTASDIEYSSGVSVADELAKIGTTHQLLNQALTTTETSYNTVANRKFSDYDLLIFRIGYGADNIRRTVVMPTNNWYSGASINESILHGSSSGHASDYNITTIGVSFNSDTSIKASVGGEGLINTLKIYGIKL